MDRKEMLANCIRSAVSQLITTNVAGAAAFGEKGLITEGSSDEILLVDIEAEDGTIYRISIEEL